MKLISQNRMMDGIGIIDYQKKEIIGCCVIIYIIITHWTFVAYISSNIGYEFDNLNIRYSNYQLFYQ